MELKAGEGNDTAEAKYESIGYQAGEDIVLDSGVIFFNSSTPNGELSFLNNTMAIYKVYDRRRPKYYYNCVGVEVKLNQEDSACSSVQVNKHCSLQSK